ncbi:MAG: acyl-ACP--UDP-N-acetylglucosamine O-acyltransferase [Muribaculaceae bacterium]|nr:acyl-ACP--UDP-N-acetylglucosamine O-acyltransferase [Muribaculaceae bacterium]
MNKISNLAYVDADAILGENVTIEAFAYIDRNVVIGNNCVIRANAIIRSGARIGNNNIIYEGCIISAEPQDFRWSGEDSLVVIGDNNKIREHVIINRSIHPGGETRIGNNSYILAQSHIGHDSIIGDYCVLGNAVKIAGDVKIGNYSIFSSNSLVHEGCDVGDWVLVKGGCRVNNNVPPYVIMAHNPIEYAGVNAFVMAKGGFSDDVIDEVAKAYRHIYGSNTSTFNGVRRIEIDIEEIPEKGKIVKFIKKHHYNIAAVAKLDED